MASKPKLELTELETPGANPPDPTVEPVVTPPAKATAVSDSAPKAAPLGFLQTKRGRYLLIGAIALGVLVYLSRRKQTAPKPEEKAAKNYVGVQ